MTAGTDDTAGTGASWADDVLDGTVDESGEDAVDAVHPAASADDAVAVEGTLGEASGELTGHPRVDDAIERLGELDSLPTAEHADVYEDVHQRLHTALTELDAD